MEILITAVKAHYFYHVMYVQSLSGQIADGGGHTLIECYLEMTIDTQNEA